MLFPWSLSGGLVMYLRGRKREGLDPFNRLALDKSGYESTELSRGVSRKSSDICGRVLNVYLTNDPDGGIYRKPKGTSSHDVNEHCWLVT